ncbi:serine/threonine-protein kinase [Nocardia coubleae]|nr:serine/threonine-protein kinase [Nocardia coubleae]
MSSTRTAEATRPSPVHSATMHPADCRALDRIEVGTRLGDFELLTELGAGAFARVFLARQRSMQRLVAVKVSADSGTEPQTLAQLDHDYIVRVFDQQVIDGSTPLRLLYMQFLPGGTLLGVLRWVRATPQTERSSALLLDAVDTAMEEKGEIRPADSAVRAALAELTWPETVAWLGARLATALSYAADNGVLHRDVKPANVLLSAEGVPKLADFNISASPADVNGGSYFGGSLPYMSPEQLEACYFAGDPADLDTRADLFSLGVLLWELLTGTKPFDDPTDDPAAVLARRRAGAVGDVPEDCPPGLRRILLTCLSPDRDHRWSDGEVLAAQLELCLDPHARALVDPAPHTWRNRLRPYLFPILALAIALPNLLAAYYNRQLNTALVHDRLDAATRQSVRTYSIVVNLMFFTVGTMVLCRLGRRLLTVPRCLRRGGRCEPHVVERTRRDCLRLADHAVALAFVLWIAAALGLAALLGLLEEDLPMRTVVHLLAVAALSAAVAMTYPFFLITLYLVRCVYPLLLHHDQDLRADHVALSGLRARCHRYLVLAASIPLLTIAGATFLPVDDLLATLTPLRTVCAGGVLGFVGALLVFRVIETDIRALLRVGSAQE